MKHLTLTKPIHDALANVRAVRGDFVWGRDSMTTLELAKLELADIVLREVEAQRRATLPRRADRGVVYVTLSRAKRKRA